MRADGMIFILNSGRIFKLFKMSRGNTEISKLFHLEAEPSRPVGRCKGIIFKWSWVGHFDPNHRLNSFLKLKLTVKSGIFAVFPGWKHPFKIWKGPPRSKSVIRIANQPSWLNTFCEWENDKFWQVFSLQLHCCLVRMREFLPKRMAMNTTWMVSFSASWTAYISKYCIELFSFGSSADNSIHSRILI